ncbi:HIT domain-containing protein, partial [candidate division WOR-3 bacterium]|nr:HIT domain-containing protein [candidate division WOR-3 bacterium]
MKEPLNSPGTALPDEVETGMDRACGFCRVLAGEAAGSFVFRDERVAAFMDLVPVNPGHMLVIPVRHAVFLSDLDPEDGVRMFRLAQALTAALHRSGPKCDAVNLFLA